MLANLLFAAVVTAPFEAYQRITGKTSGQQKHYRNRVFGGTFYGMCFADVAIALLLLAQPGLKPDAGSMIGRRIAFPVIILVTGFGRKDGFGRNLVRAYKEPTDVKQVQVQGT